MRGPGDSATRPLRTNFWNRQFLVRRQAPPMSQLAEVTKLALASFLGSSGPRSGHPYHETGSSPLSPWVRRTGVMAIMACESAPRSRARPADARPPA